MMKLKNIFAVAALAFGVSTAVSAQEDDSRDYKPAPYMFFGLQGGAQTTFTNYDNLKLITPTYSFSFGSFFTPVVGARLHFNGYQNKGGYKDAMSDFKYDYKYLTSDLDLMINLVTLFGQKDYYPVNLYLIGGIGLNYAWDNDDAFAMKTQLPMAWEKNRFSHNARVGAMLDWNLNKHLSLNLEVDANSLSDRYNEYIMLRFRTAQGVSISYIKSHFKDFFSSFQQNLSRSDFAEYFAVNGDYVNLNLEGLYISDYIISEFFM
mgnify:CR=1 FL=1